MNPWRFHEILESFSIFIKIVLNRGETNCNKVSISNLIVFLKTAKIATEKWQHFKWKLI